MMRSGWTRLDDEGWTDASARYAVAIPRVVQPSNLISSCVREEESQRLHYGEWERETRLDRLDGWTDGEPEESADDPPGRQSKSTPIMAGNAQFFREQLRDQAGDHMTLHRVMLNERDTGVETERALCLLCERPFERPQRSRKGACAACTAAPCAGGCGKASPVYATYPSVIRSRNGKPWTCAKCVARQRAEDPAWADAARERAKDPDVLAKIRAAAQDPARNEKLRRAALTPERREKASREQRERCASPEARTRQAENGRKGAAKRWGKDRHPPVER
jgi:hypothetical protein